MSDDTVKKEICKSAELKETDISSIVKIGKPTAKNKQICKITFNSNSITPQTFFAVNQTNKTTKFEFDKTYQDRIMTKALLKRRYEMKLENPSLVGKIKENKLILSNGNEYVYSFVHQKVMNA